MKRNSTIKWKIPANVERVWEIVTNNQDVRWRSDVEHLEIISENVFIEHFKGGGQTKFTIVAKEANQLYAFQMGNKFFQGEWVGRFEEVSSEETVLNFSEQLDIKNPIIYVLSFFMMNLKKMQRTYMEDLQRRVADEN
ncbi:SRPBCC family protein [Enterococcus alishanensis]|uniref:SRPBCC family protein n=1 Tax=Enterococcus alishanensis TaxID=1303817 RepID=A0ABS6TD39_9ENTE|nr:SRPBCC family protein [Enterococcus alishanensis]MBV7390795.1 SRPBCC family protein [Enterococcus alishanensis]